MIKRFDTGYEKNSDKLFRDLSAKEQADKDAGRFVTHEKVNMPSGVLTLTIEHYMDGLRSKWRDTTSTPLEQNLPEFVVGLCNAADCLIEANLRREKEHARWAKERNIRTKADQLQETWNSKATDVMSQFERWQQAEQCRIFIHQVKERLNTSGELSDAQKHWLSWANDIANQLDPISDLVDSDFTDWNPQSSLINHVRQQAILSLTGDNASPLTEYFPYEEIEALLIEMNLKIKDSSCDI